MDPRRCRRLRSGEARLAAHLRTPTGRRNASRRRLGAPSVPCRSGTNVQHVGLAWLSARFGEQTAGQGVRQLDWWTALPSLRRETVSQVAARPGGRTEPCARVASRERVKCPIPHSTPYRHYSRWRRTWEGVTCVERWPCGQPSPGKTGGDNHRTAPERLRGQLCFVRRLSFCRGEPLCPNSTNCAEPDRNADRQSPQHSGTGRLKEAAWSSK